MVKWIGAVLALAGLGQIVTAPSIAPPSKTPSPALVPSKQSPVQLNYLASDGTPYPPPPRPTPPCCQ